MVLGINCFTGMSSPDDLLPQQHLRTMQINVAAFIAAVAAFLAIVLIIVSVRTDGKGMAPRAGLPVISLAAFAWFVLDAPLAFIFATMQTRAALRKIASGTWQPGPRNLLPWPTKTNPSDYNTDTAKLLAVRQTMTLMIFAPLEGMAFFGCIAYLVEAQDFVLGVILVPVILMLLCLPTESRVRAWLEKQTDRLAELRQQARLAAEP